jgi:cbb3-type cytochrome oxidase subunit 1
MESRTLVFNDKVSRQFVAASVLWGIAAMLVGAIAAHQLAVPGSNLAPYLTFGRLRPLHTNAAIFAFVGNMIFAASIIRRSAS